MMANQQSINRELKHLRKLVKKYIISGNVFNDDNDQLLNLWHRKLMESILYSDTDLADIFLDAGDVLIDIICNAESKNKG